jgi:hypothetical protein
MPPLRDLPGLYAPDAGLTMSTIADDAVECPAHPPALCLLLQRSTTSRRRHLAYFVQQLGECRPPTPTTGETAGSADGLPPPFTPAALPAPFCPTDPGSRADHDPRRRRHDLKKWIDRAIDH